MDGAWRLLEPIMSVEVNAPSEFQSSVVGQLIKKRAIITSNEENEEWFVIEAEVRKK